MAAALPKIKPCPHCGEPLWFYYGPDPSLIQWTFWTDGYNTQQLDPIRGGEFRRCSLCRKFFVEDAISSDEALENLMRMLDEPQPLQPAEATGEAEYVGVDDFYGAMSVVRKELSRPQERALRVEAWRLENHRVRALRWNDNPLRDSEIYFSAAAVDSLRRLFDLLDDKTEAHRFYRAEIARELGAFGSAAELFGGSNFVELRLYAERAQKLALGGDRYVANFR